MRPPIPFTDLLEGQRPTSLSDLLEGMALLDQKRVRRRRWRALLQPLTGRRARMAVLVMVAIGIGAYLGQALAAGSWSLTAEQAIRAIDAAVHTSLGVILAALVLP